MTLRIYPKYCSIIVSTFLLSACAPFDPIDPSDTERVVSLVQGCYAFDGEPALRIVGNEVRQDDGAFMATITGSGPARSWKAIDISSEILLDVETASLTRGRAIPNASLFYRLSDSRIEIEMATTAAKRVILKAIPCAEL